MNTGVVLHDRCLPFFFATLRLCVRLAGENMTQFTIEFDQETDGRWIAEIPLLPGALCYGSSKEEAFRKVEALALRILADRIEHGEAVPELAGTFIAASA